MTQERNNKLERKYTIYDQSVVEKILSGYNLSEKDGIGLVFLVKCLDKTKKIVSLYPTFFDISTKQILWTFEVDGYGLSKGLDKYWIKKIFDAVDNFLAHTNPNLRSIRNTSECPTCLTKMSFGLFKVA